ncbi:MAG: hypothetical protein K6G50_13595 [bacterium]|nr:hypothetical protein [bacterium]
MKMQRWLALVFWGLMLMLPALAETACSGSGGVAGDLRAYCDNDWLKIYSAENLEVIASRRLRGASGFKASFSPNGWLIAREGYWEVADLRTAKTKWSHEGKSSWGPELSGDYVWNAEESDGELYLISRSIENGAESKRVKLKEPVSWAENIPQGLLVRAGAKLMAVSPRDGIMAETGDHLSYNGKKAEISGNPVILEGVAVTEVTCGSDYCLVAFALPDLSFSWGALLHGRPFETPALIASDSAALSVSEKDSACETLVFSPKTGELFISYPAGNGTPACTFLRNEMPWTMAEEQDGSVSFYVPAKDSQPCQVYSSPGSFMENPLSDNPVSVLGSNVIFMQEESGQHKSLTAIKPEFGGIVWKYDNDGIYCFYPHEDFVFAGIAAADPLTGRENTSLEFREAGTGTLRWSVPLPGKIISAEFIREGELLVSTDSGNACLVSIPQKEVASELSLAPVFDWTKWNNLAGVLLLSGCIGWYIARARKHELFIRKIAGLSALDEAVGRATEMGKPVLYVPGVADVDDVQTLASLSILRYASRCTAEYDTQIIVPNCCSVVMSMAQEIVQEAYMRAGRPDSFRRDDVLYLSDEQFGFAAGVSGIMVRERPAAMIYMGNFLAEALILAETGNSVGAIQIAGSATASQLPFFVAACDYTLIGEELYAASAYLSGDPLQVGSLKGQDAAKLAIMILLVIGAVLSSCGVTWINDLWATM